MLRVIMAVAIMFGLFIGLAVVPRLVVRPPDRSEKAKACRASARIKYPVEMVEVTNTADGNARVLVNRNSGAERAEYRDCMRK